MRSVLLILVIGCGADGPAGEGQVNTDGVDCGDICPEGTRKASFDAVIRGTGQAILGEECETICESIVPCSPPNVPEITATSYACAPLEGYVAFPPDSEVDFAWASGWVTP